MTKIKLNHLVFILIYVLGLNMGYFIGIMVSSKISTEELILLATIVGDMFNVIIIAVITYVILYVFYNLIIKRKNKTSETKEK